MEIDRCGIFSGTGKTTPVVDLEYDEPVDPAAIDLAKSYVSPAATPAQRQSLAGYRAGRLGTDKRHVRISGAVKDELPTGDCIVGVQMGNRHHTARATAFGTLYEVAGRSREERDRERGEELAEELMRDAERVASSSETVAEAQGFIARETMRVAQAEERTAAAGEEIGRGVSALSGFPVEVSVQRDGGGGGTASGGASSRVTVDAVMRSLVGRELPEGSSADAGVPWVLSALDRHFSVKVEAGVEQWSYQRSGYLSTTVNGAGVTGAAASLADFTQWAQGEIVDSVRGLEPLGPVVLNQDEPEAHINALVVAITRFAREVLRDGGPREGLAQALIAQSQRQLDRLGVEFKMARRVDGRLTIDRRYVLRREDEEKITAYIIARDRLEALALAFARYDTQEVGGQDFGLEQFGLQRDLRVLPRQADRLKDALASLGIDDEQASVIVIADGAVAPVTLADAISLVYDFAEEADELLQSSGIPGAGVIEAMLGPVRDAVAAAREHVADFLPDPAPAARVNVQLAAVDESLQRIAHRTNAFAGRFAQVNGAAAGQPAGAV